MLLQDVVARFGSSNSRRNPFQQFGADRGLVFWLAARCPGRSLDQQRSLIECGAAGSRQSQRSQSDIDGLVGLDNCQLELHPSSGKLGL